MLSARMKGAADNTKWYCAARDLAHIGKEIMTKALERTATQPTSISEASVKTLAQLFKQMEACEVLPATIEAALQSLPVAERDVFCLCLSTVVLEKISDGIRDCTPTQPAHHDQAVAPDQPAATGR